MHILPLLLACYVIIIMLMCYVRLSIVSLLFPMYIDMLLCGMVFQMYKVGLVKKKHSKTSMSPSADISSKQSFSFVQMSITTAKWVKYKHVLI